MKAFMLSCGKNCTLSLERVVKKKRNAVDLDLTITLPSQWNAPAVQRNILQQCCTRAPVGCRGIIHQLAKYCKRVSKRTGHRLMRNNVAICWLETYGAFDRAFTRAVFRRLVNMKRNKKITTNLNWSLFPELKWLHLRETNISYLFIQRDCDGSFLQIRQVFL